MLADIVLDEVDEKYIISEKYKNRLSVSEDLKKRFSAINPNKALCMTARQYANWKGTLVVALTERRTDEAKKIRSKMMKEHGKDFSPRRGKELTQRDDGKMNCLTATFSSKEHTLFDAKNQYRKLTPVECERLQTLPDNYSSAVSDAQRYKMIGNGWTVDIIAHILGSMRFVDKPSSIGPCAKQTVNCVIISENGKRYSGTNYCNNAQPSCPREVGEDYTKCKTICQQSGHAEINALAAAGENARGGRAVLSGHTYVCMDCQHALFAAGVKSISVV